MAAAVAKMTLGNGIGFKFTQPQRKEQLFTPDYGALLLEVSDSEVLTAKLHEAGFTELGETTAGPSVVCDETVIMLADIEAAFTQPLESIFPTKIKQSDKEKAVSTLYTVTDGFNACFGQINSPGILIGNPG